MNTWKFGIHNTNVSYVVDSIQFGKIATLSMEIIDSQLVDTTDLSFRLWGSLCQGSKGRKAAS